MNTIHNNGNSEDRVPGDLDQVGQVYEQMEQAEPPELVDQAILNTAHRAVGKKPHWMKFGWLHGLTTAAIFGLAVSLVMKQPENQAVLEDSAGINGDVELIQRSEQASIRTHEKREVDTAILPEPGSVDAAGQAEEPAASPAATLEITEPRTDNSLNAKKPEPDIRERAGDDKAGAVPGKSAARQQRGAQLTTSAATEAPAPASASDEFSDTDSEIEEKLQAILRLKEAGDETWRAELEKFRRNHPDYPLPEELRPQ